MKHILVFVIIICVALFVGAQEEVAEPIPEPVPIVSRLNVTLTDDIGGHTFKLENAIVQVIGELHVAGDSITYSDMFADGDMYEMIIWIKRR